MNIKIDQSVLLNITIVVVIIFVMKYFSVLYAVSPSVRLRILNNTRAFS